VFGESPEMKEPQISLNPSSDATHVLCPYPPAQSPAMCCLAPPYPLLEEVERERGKQTLVGHLR
ncbi:hypothetical protein B0O80DRAFT_440853, partial [Mortierella sp. GBAus27b]